MDKHSDAMDEQKTRAKEYREAYCYGFWCAGRKHSASEADVGGSPSYPAGFARGVSAAKLAKDGESAAQSANKIVSDAVDAINQMDEYGQGRFDEEHWKRWKSLQAVVKANGEKGWQDFLLELYRSLRSYGEFAKSATYEERAAMALLEMGV